MACWKKDVLIVLEVLFWFMLGSSSVCTDVIKVNDMVCPAKTSIWITLIFSRTCLCEYPEAILNTPEPLTACCTQLMSSKSTAGTSAHRYCKLPSLCTFKMLFRSDLIYFTCVNHQLSSLYKQIFHSQE